VGKRIGLIPEPRAGAHSRTALPSLLSSKRNAGNATVTRTKKTPQKARQASHQARGGAIGARTGQGSIDAEKAAAATFLAPLPEDYLDSEAASPDYSGIILRQGNRLIGALWDYGTTFNLAPWKAAATAIAEILSRLAWPSLKLSPELEALTIRYHEARLENPSLKPSPELEALLWKEAHTQAHVWAALREGGNKELAQEITAMPEAPKKLEAQRQKRVEGAKDKNERQGKATGDEVERLWKKCSSPDNAKRIAYVCKHIKPARTPECIRWHVRNRGLKNKTTTKTEIR
jgi:hypothetical protein